MVITTYDLDNVYQNKVFEFHWNGPIELTRGTNNGELHILHDKENITFSNDFSDTWIQLNNFSFDNFYGVGITEGWTNGEVYIKCTYANMMWANAQTYILHSNDYGKTFEVFHPFSRGNQSVLANFSSAQAVGTAPYTIEWCNFSIGENASYEWDFDNYGIIDSNEENPVYIYEEPGIYPVKLSVVGSDNTNSFLKEDYIPVYPFAPPPQDFTAEVIDDDVCLNWQPILLDTTLLGYIVYRNSTLLTPEPIPSVSYEDLNLPNGTYEYCVEEVYTYAVSEKCCVGASITVGMEEWEEAGFRIYPYPADENIHIQFT